MTALRRRLPLGLALALTAPLAAQDGVAEVGAVGGGEGDGRWYRMATGGDAPPSAATPGDGELDADALYDLADRTQGIAAELAALRTGEPVRGHQREVEERLTALIGILEREGG